MSSKVLDLQLYSSSFVLLLSVAELSQGFGGKLSNDRATFTVLERGMIAAAIILLTVCHTGLTFGRTNWEQAS
jgi:hypothetical protein